GYDRQEDGLAIVEVASVARHAWTMPEAGRPYDRQTPRCFVGIPRVGRVGRGYAPDAPRPPLPAFTANPAPRHSPRPSHPPRRPRRADLRRSGLRPRRLQFQAGVRGARGGGPGGGWYIFGSIQG